MIDHRVQILRLWLFARKPLLNQHRHKAHFQLIKYQVADKFARAGNAEGNRFLNLTLI